MRLSNLSKAVMFAINNPYMILDNPDGLIVGATNDNEIILSLSNECTRDVELYIPKTNDYMFFKGGCNHVKISLSDAIKASKRKICTVDNTILSFVKENLGKVLLINGLEAVVAGYDDNSVVIGFIDDDRGWKHEKVPFPAYIYIKAKSYVYTQVDSIQNLIVDSFHDYIYDDSDMNISEFNGNSVIGFNVLQRYLILAGTSEDKAYFPIIGDYIKDPETDMSNIKRVYL